MAAPTRADLIDAYAAAGLFPADEPDEFPTWLPRLGEAAIEVAAGFVVADLDEDGARVVIRTVTASGVERTKVRVGFDPMGMAALPAVLRAVVEVADNPEWADR